MSEAKHISICLYFPVYILCSFFCLIVSLFVLVSRCSFCSEEIDSLPNIRQLDFACGVGLSFSF